LSTIDPITSDARNKNLGDITLRNKFSHRHHNLHPLRTKRVPPLNLRQQEKYYRERENDNSLPTTPNDQSLHNTVIISPATNTPDTKITMRKGYLSTKNGNNTSTITNRQSRLPIDTTPSNKILHPANNVLSSHQHHANIITTHANIITLISRYEYSTVVLHETSVDSKYSNHGSTILDTHYI